MIKSHHQDHDVERIAAEITVLALRATLGGPRQPLGRQYLMLPKLFPLDEATVVRELVSLMKPLACVAMDAAGAIGIACWPQHGTAAAAAHLERYERAEPYWHGLRTTLVERHGSRLVTVEGHKECLTVDIDDIREWERRYHVLFASTVISIGQRRKGTAIMRIHRADPTAGGEGVGAL
jgi:hypothetical protein